MQESKNSVYEEVGVHTRVCETLSVHPADATPCHAA